MKFVILPVVLVAFAACVQGIDYLNGVYPGTNWCAFRSRGPGLGNLTAVDACCKAQFQCPKQVKAWSTKYCIRNILSPVPMSSCTCLNAFHSCLKAVTGDEKVHADKIGKFIFNTLNLVIKCFEIDGMSCCREYGWKYKKVLFAKVPYRACIRYGENGVRKATPTY